jgi:phosphatidylglycerophosphate synthase
MAQVTGIIVLPRRRPESADAARVWTRSIGGLPLLLRQARVLGAAGCARIYLCGDDEHEPLLAAIRSGRLGLPGARFLARRAPSAEAAGGERAAIEGPFVLLSGDFVFGKAAVGRAVESASRGDSLCLFATPAGEVGLVASAGLGAGLAALERGPTPARAAADAPRASPVAGEDFIGIVTDDRSLSEAERRLWDGCRKAADGLIATHLDRHVSLAISRRLVRRPLTPNQVTVANFVLGVAAALVAALGGYWPVLVAALLFELNSVLDGVDGELARIRLESSVLGEWLDTIGDDACNLLFFVALGVGAWRETGAELWLWAAGLFAVPAIAVALVYYAKLLRMGRGDVLATPLFQAGKNGGAAPVLERLVAIGTRVFRKDMITFVVLCAALLGLARYVLPVVAAGTWIVLAVQIAEMARPARAGSAQPRIT